VGGGRVLTGTEVDREGGQIGTLEVSSRVHILDLNLVIKRVPMRLNLHYGELEEAKQ